MLGWWIAKVLQETNGDIDAAIQSLRERDYLQQLKNQIAITKEGRVITAIDHQSAVILELNCETDFVANNDVFITLGKTIATAIAKQPTVSVDDIQSMDVNGFKVVS